jgi:hypothetical protein
MNALRKSFWIFIWFMGYFLESVFWALVVVAPIAIIVGFALAVVIIKLGFLS